MVGLLQMIQEEVRVSGLDSVVGLYDVIVSESEGTDACAKINDSAAGHFD